VDETKKGKRDYFIKRYYNKDDFYKRTEKKDKVNAKLFLRFDNKKSYCIDNIIISWPSSNEKKEIDWTKREITGNDSEAHLIIDNAITITLQKAVALQKGSKEDSKTVAVYINKIFEYLFEKEGLWYKFYPEGLPKEGVWVRANDNTLQYYTEGDATHFQKYGKNEGTTYQEKDTRGNVIVDYRKDGSIMFSNEKDAYKRMVSNSKVEEMGAITDNGVLVLPTWANDATTSSPAHYGYIFKDGKLTDPVSNKDIDIIATVHTHPGSGCGDMGLDGDFAKNNTPGKPMFALVLGDRLEICENMNIEKNDILYRLSSGSGNITRGKIYDNTSKLKCEYVTDYNVLNILPESSNSFSLREVAKKLKTWHEDKCKKLILK